MQLSPSFYRCGSNSDRDASALCVCINKRVYDVPQRIDINIKTMSTSVKFWTRICCIETGMVSLLLREV